MRPKDAKMSGKAKLTSVYLRVEPDLLGVPGDRNRDCLEKQLGRTCD